MPSSRCICIFCKISIELLIYLNKHVEILVCFNRTLDREVTFPPYNQRQATIGEPQTTMCGTASISPLAIRILFLTVPLSSPLSRYALTSTSFNPSSLTAFMSVSMLAGGCASSKYDLYNESSTLILEPLGPFS